MNGSILRYTLFMSLGNECMLFTSEAIEKDNAQ